MDAEAATGEHGRVEQVYPTGGDGGWRAVPGLEEDSQRETDRLVTTLDVDGQRFAVRPDGHGGSHYTWLNGPDPRTGHIEDD